MTDKKLEYSIVLPAYNEEKVIGSVVEQILNVMHQTEQSFEVIVINDGSDDQTGKEAEEAGARVVNHPYNIGNGAAIKTGIRESIGKIIVMMDADGQHSPKDILKLIDAMDECDMVVGARTKKSEASLHRNLANKLYNLLATYVSGYKIEDLTSGFRAIRADVAQRFVYLLPNKFSYPTTITLAVLRSGRSLAYIPIATRRRIGKSKIKLLRDGFKFLMIILRVATYYSPLKVFFPVSVLMFLTGFGYGLFKVLVLGTRYGPTSAMLMTISVVVFMVGLVSEQVAQLRYIWSEHTKRGQNSSG